MSYIIPPDNSGIQRPPSDLWFVLQVGKILKIPVIKFLLHAASYLWFLITLLGESITMEMYRDKFASRHQDILHSSFHMVWVVGKIVFLCFQNVFSQFQ